jgi:hypothetical protein
LSSQKTVGPYIDEWDVGVYPRDVLHISEANTSDIFHDIRSDARIKNELTSLGLFHGGITVRLDSVKVLVNADTSTLEYGFSITNIDADNLLVFDPDKTGSELFHYYTNGVILVDSSGKGIGSSLKTTSPPDSFQHAWYTELYSGASISRVVQLKGYGRIPIGNLSCLFIFPSGPVNIKAQDRYYLDGRIWLGEALSNSIFIEVQ